MASEVEIFEKDTRLKLSRCLDLIAAADQDQETLSDEIYFIFSEIYLRLIMYNVNCQINKPFALYYDEAFRIISAKLPSDFLAAFSFGKKWKHETVQSTKQYYSTSTSTTTSTW